VDRCDTCGSLRIAYHSCRNRHCPKCQHMPRERWLAKRQEEILPVNYFHVVFTLPHELNAVILNHKRLMLNCLFAAVSQTILRFSKNEMGGTPGFLAILHTWDQKLQAHFHLHCLVAGGAAGNAGCWNYLFNQRALSLVFRGKFMQLLHRACQSEKLKCEREWYQNLKNTLFAKNWVVSVRNPVKDPQQVLDYLASYTHRVAIANSRIQSFKTAWSPLARKIERKIAPSRLPSARWSLSAGSCCTAYPPAWSESATMGSWPTATERPIYPPQGPCWDWPRPAPRHRPLSKN
jgi:hypothetical protein